MRSKLINAEVIGKGVDKHGDYIEIESEIVIRHKTILSQLRMTHKFYQHRRTNRFYGGWKPTELIAANVYVGNKQIDASRVKFAEWQRLYTVISEWANHNI